MDPVTLDSATGLLACPVCAGPLDLVGGAEVCPNRHSFDKARQGYVNLLRGSAPANADTADMVAARDRFLGGGVYQPIAEAVADLCQGSTILDVGAGTGYYLAHILEHLPNARGVATDVSVPAIRRAAKAHTRMAAVVADTWVGLPVRDGVMDSVVCVFAPRNAAEFGRVLRPGGTVVVASPRPTHLAQLRASLGLLNVEADKQTRLAETFAAGFVAGPSHACEWTVRLEPGQVRDLVDMGPNAFHGGAQQTLPAVDVEVQVAVDVTTWTRA